MNNIFGYNIKILTKNTVVVGAGAAGLAAAYHLVNGGNRDVVLLCENRGLGTSFNAGSDKQTYYKLALAGNQLDSVRTLASVLYGGGCMDGDIALVEAALSAPCFLRLCSLGVPFPQNQYGEYIGYKTDHDPAERATSAGPLTSKMMVEALNKAVEELQIPILDHMQIIAVLQKDGEIYGLLCLNTNQNIDDTERYVLFNCKNVIYATGGPGALYSDSVFPKHQYGGTGVALEAGILGKNLTEWQFGLASVAPRWNVSGTYMQVLPRIYSTDQDGNDEREFLLDYYDGKLFELLNNVFLKGYQWPFDIRKITGSSAIDILVYYECIIKNRRVYLDYCNNPGKEETLAFDDIMPEARAYLERAGALFGRPIDRLRHMNEPAYQLYHSKGVDLAKQPLRISVSAQHNNGGLGVDAWWQTNVAGFFAVGEAAATHGVYRPGGSALNAGQVGAQRAAQYIVAQRSGNPVGETVFWETIQEQVREKIALAQRKGGLQNRDILECVQKTMSEVAGIIRDPQQLSETKDLLERILFCEDIPLTQGGSLSRFYHVWDVLLCQYVYISAMVDYLANGGKSRGSALYCAEDGKCTAPVGGFRYYPDDNTKDSKIQEVVCMNREFHFSWREPRPIPPSDSCFENVWRQYQSEMK